MDLLPLPDADKRKNHHSSQPQIQTSMSDFPSALAAMVAASSAATIAVPYLSINRMAYSLSSFNQQFRRLSQLSDLSRTRKNSSRSLPSTHSKQSSRRQPRFITKFLVQSRKSLSKISNRCFKCPKWCTSICASLTPFALCKRYLPVIEWVSEYQRTDLMPDLLAGLTIAVFHVPECMGYSFLANVNPIYCLYSSLFPTLIYALMGTSQYCSVGTFAALSIMTGTVIKETKWIMHRENMLKNSEMLGSDRSGSFTNATFTGDVSSEKELANGSMSPLVDQLQIMVTYSNEEIAFVCTFVVGLYLFLFGIFRLGFMSVYMSEQFLNGFTCSVAYHVVASQLQHMLGLPRTDTESGQFILFQYLSHIYHHLADINTVALGISIFTAVLILFSKLYIDPWLQKYRQLNISFPIEFLVVVFGVAFSRLLDLSTHHDVQIIGPIQTGLPEPSVPSVGTLFKHLWQPCISIAVVSYAITYSVGRTFLDQVYDSKGDNRQQQNKPLDHRCWEINPSQELVALGCSNLLASFFSCIPSGASLSRSAIQFGSGGRTQLVSIINCFAILLVLYMSSFFKTLPNAILATIISVALRDLLANVYQFKRYWDISKVDASVWMVTFLCVVIIDINWGLYIGLLYSLVTLIYKSQLPPAYLLGAVGQIHELYSLDFFVPLDQYVNARELQGIKIFQFCGPLHFANVDYFMKKLETKLNISIKDLIKIKTIMIQISTSFGRVDQDRPSTISSSNLELFRSFDDILDEEDDEDILLSHFPCSTNGPFCSTLSLSMLPMGNSLAQSSDSRTLEAMVRRYRRFLKRVLPDYLVIDCSMFSYIDTDGLKMMKRLVKEFNFLDVKVFLGGCPSHVGRLLEKFQLDQSNESGQVIYISVPDAIEHARQEQQDLARSRSMMVINDQVIGNSLQQANELVKSNELSSFSSLPFDQYHCPQIFTSNSGPLSSLFSSTTATSMLSITDDSVIQQMTIPSVIELPHDDCHSLSIEEDIINDNDHTNRWQANQVRIDAEVYITVPSHAYFEVI